MQKTDYPLDSWSFAKDDCCGMPAALREFYPNLLGSDLRLQVAVTQIELAELAIDAIMADLARKEDQS